MTLNIPIEVIPEAVNISKRSIRRFKEPSSYFENKAKKKDG